MRKINREYRTIANRIIKKRPELKDIIDFDIKIVYLSDDKEKKKDHKLVYADCEKVNEKYAWAIKYDFMITVYEPNVEGLTSEQMEILLFHELLHVGVSATGSEPKFYVVPHDIEDFAVIIEEHGLYWNEKR